MLDGFSKIRKGREAGFRRDLTSEYTQSGDQNLETIMDVIKEGSPEVIKEANEANEGEKQE